MTSSIQKSIFTLFTVILSSAFLSGQEVTKETPGGYTHDGFFLRLQPGLGYAAFVEKASSGADQTIGDLGISGCLQIGGTLDDNFILYGELSSVAVGDLEEAGDDDFTVLGAGAGLSYYIMPQNFYLSCSLLFINGDREKDGRRVNTSGFGSRVSLGKEWWVSENWGIGIALVGHIDYKKLADTDHNAFSYYTGLALSATYN